LLLWPSFYVIVVGLAVLFLGQLVDGQPS